VKETRMEAARTALAVSQVVTLRKSRMVLSADTSVIREEKGRVIRVIAGVEDGLTKINDS